ncbi:hypothetical protein [Actinokineospora sp. UTMC 2448]|uniref:hypothetical protein n=1 Tax=Actinokineospora sp. UTMC 2448 TaxID=2268449 RepID=UPI00216480C0|nr:hypothetical protein [Actinokineospora sp. UTMC 2448]UVS81841.1 hypothetical protein Actkin_05605 [Actinokineospora sp. UTMC 2448]
MTSDIKELTATGNVTTRDAYLALVVLTAGADAASAVLRAGGSGGTVELSVKATAGATTVVPVPSAFFGGGIHATLTGTSPTLSVCWE